MSYYPDLSPYVYSGAHPELINIGWLGTERPFPKGIVEPGLLATIGKLCRSPSNLTRGYHKCPWCDGYPVREAYLGDGRPMPMGNGEIHVSAGGIYWTYSAPTLIYHYILRHQYLPPKEFLDAVDRLVD
jgi:hypothetical protein